MISKVKSNEHPSSPVMVNKIAMQLENFEDVYLFYILIHLNKDDGKLDNYRAMIELRIL